MEFPFFRLVPVASHPATGHHWEESSSIFPPPIRYLYIVTRSLLSLLFMISWLCTKTLRSFSAAAGQPLVHTGVWGYYILCARHHISLQTLWDSCWRTPSASSECHHNHLLYQPFLLVFFITRKLVKAVLSPIIQVISENIKQFWPQYRTLGCTMSDWPPDGLHVTDHNPLILTVQPDFKPPHCPFTSSTIHQFVYKDVIGYSVKSLVKIGINDIHCAPLIHLATHLIIEGYHDGQAWFQHIKFTGVSSFEKLEKENRTSSPSGLGFHNSWREIGVSAFVVTKNACLPSGELCRKSKIYCKSFITCARILVSDLAWT